MPWDLAAHPVSVKQRVATSFIGSEGNENEQDGDGGVMHEHHTCLKSMLVHRQPQLMVDMAWRDLFNEMVNPQSRFYLRSEGR